MLHSRRSMPEEVIHCVIRYIHDPRDRSAVSQVCHRWYEIDAEERKNLTIAFCYSTTAERLFQRFPNIECLKLKGKPRAAMFNLIPEDWGGYAAPWVNFLYQFRNLNSIHFRRMIVSDADIEIVANVKCATLQCFKLDKCSGFSTDGLSYITRSCRDLKTLYLKDSVIDEINGEWLHQLAINNRTLRTLIFTMTYLEHVSFEDLLLIAQNCPLVCLKFDTCLPLNIATLFHVATGLEKFTGGSPFSEQMIAENYPVIPFPSQLRHLGLFCVRPVEITLYFPITHLLKSLNLICSLLDGENSRMLIQRCPNLQDLLTTDVIGDEGLDILSRHCKRLKRLRIEQGVDAGLADEQGSVTQIGLTALSVGCKELEYLAVYVSDITNDALQSIGANLKNLRDFRLVLVDRGSPIADLPLDNGVRALLIGCQLLRRFALYLQEGGLTDLGLHYIGQYSLNVTWMLLGHLGDTDQGLLALSRGCPSLLKLEMRGCRFSGHALAQASRQFRSLKFMWVQGYVGFQNGEELLGMTREHWFIEIIPPTVKISDVDEDMMIQEHLVQVVGYYSLAGQRADYPEGCSVVPLDVPVTLPVNLQDSPTVSEVIILGEECKWR